MAVELKAKDLKVGAYHGSTAKYTKSTSLTIFVYSNTHVLPYGETHATEYSNPWGIPGMNPGKNVIPEDTPKPKPAPAPVPVPTPAPAPKPTPPKTFYSGTLGEISNGKTISVVWVQAIPAWTDTKDHYRIRWIGVRDGKRVPDQDIEKDASLMSDRNWTGTKVFPAIVSDDIPADLRNWIPTDASFDSSERRGVTPFWTYVAKPPGFSLTSGDKLSMQRLGDGTVSSAGVEPEAIRKQNVPTPAPTPAPSPTPSPSPSPNVPAPAPKPQASRYMSDAEKRIVIRMATGDNEGHPKGWAGRTAAQGAQFAGGAVVQGAQVTWEPSDDWWNGGGGNPVRNFDALNRVKYKPFDTLQHWHVLMEDEGNTARNGEVFADIRNMCIFALFQGRDEWVLIEKNDQTDWLNRFGWDMSTPHEGIYKSFKAGESYTEEQVFIGDGVSHGGCGDHPTKGWVNQGKLIAIMQCAEARISPRSPAGARVAMHQGCDWKWSNDASILAWYPGFGVSATMKLSREWRRYYHCTLLEARDAKRPRAISSAEFMKTKVPLPDLGANYVDTPSPAPAPSPAAPQGTGYAPGTVGALGAGPLNLAWIQSLPTDANGNIFTVRMMGVQNGHVIDDEEVKNMQGLLNGRAWDGFKSFPAIVWTNGELPEDIGDYKVTTLGADISNWQNTLPYYQQAIWKDNAKFGDLSETVKLPKPVAPKPSPTPAPAPAAPSGETHLTTWGESEWKDKHAIAARIRTDPGDFSGNIEFEVITVNSCIVKSNSEILSSNADLEERRDMHNWGTLTMPAILWYDKNGNIPRDISDQIVQQITVDSSILTSTLPGERQVLAKGEYKFDFIRTSGKAPTFNNKTQEQSDTKNITVGRNDYDLKEERPSTASLNSGRSLGPVGGTMPPGNDDVPAVKRNPTNGTPSNSSGKKNQILHVWSDGDQGRRGGYIFSDNHGPALTEFGQYVRNTWFMGAQGSGNPTSGVPVLDGRKGAGTSMIDAADYALAAMANGGRVAINMFGAPTIETANFAVTSKQVSAMIALRSGMLPIVTAHHVSTDWNPDNDSLGYALRAVMMSDGVNYSILVVNRSSRTCEISLGMPLSNGRHIGKGVFCQAPNRNIAYQPGNDIHALPYNAGVPIQFTNGVGARLSVPPFCAMSVLFNG